jgi:hypothetical protein
MTSLYFMTRILKIVICLGLGIFAARNLSAFSNWGPAESWQTQDLDFGIRYLPFFPLPNLDIFGVTGPGSLDAINTELGGTKNIGEGSRLNVPIITYAYDSTFLSYFGAQGETAIDSAFAVLNGLPTASSANLNSFITQGNQQINYTAQAMRMLDLKSTVLWLMMEHMGLIGETHTYDLRERSVLPGDCVFDYVVETRNFDPVSYSPSDYVNGTLLTYQIGDLCFGGNQVGDAMEQVSQVGLPPFSSVATREALQVGGYYLRITRDDMGGLKYLYSKNRYVNEGFDGNVTVNPSAAGTSAYSPISLSATNSGDVGGTFSGLMGGVEKITFVKTPYDGQLGSTFTPRTYHYTIPMYNTNGSLVSVPFTRTVTAPDIIFTAGDLTYPGPDPYQVTLDRTSGFITYGAAVSPGVNAVTPSVITPEMVVTLNNSGQVYYNGDFSGVELNDQATSPELGFIWGSFNGSSNAPIVFPTGASIAAVEAAVLEASGGSNLLGGAYTPVSVATNSTATTTTTTTVTP